MISVGLCNLRSFITTIFLVTLLVISVESSSLASGLIVNSFNSDAALEYDPRTGDFVKPFTQFGQLMGPEGIFIDNNEVVFISSSGTDEIITYEGATGTQTGIFVTAGSGGLDDPQEFVFGPGGDLYVASFGSDEILRYNGNTGEFIETFVTAGSGGLDGPTALLFTSNKLLVASFLSDEVIEYNPDTGDFVQVLVSSGSGGLDGPEALLILNNNLLVASFDTDEVLQYNRSDGTFLGAFVTAGSGGLDGPTCLSRGQNEGSHLNVCSFESDEVLRYSRVTGEFLQVYITAGDGGLDGPTGFAFKPGIFNDDSDCSLAGPGGNYSFPYMLLLVPFLYIAVRRLVSAYSKA